MKIELGGKLGKLTLSMIPLKDVLPHESTIPRLLQSIRQDMERTGFQRDPIIIDQKTRVALDGMHRRATLSSLGARYCLCAEFDYLGGSVKLERWLRYLIAPSSNLVNQILSMFSMIRCKDRKEAIRLVDGHQSGVALLSDRYSYVSDAKLPESRQETVKQIYTKVREFDSLCDALGIQLDFAPEGNINSLFSSEAVHVLYPSPLTKQDVIENAMKKRLFPFKTTRHILRVRPMGVYFPVNALCESDLPACEKLLSEIVNSSKWRAMLSQVWYEGRSYSEPLVVFRRQAE